MDAVLQFCAAEIDDESQAFSGKPQVRETPSTMDGMIVDARLAFHDHEILNEQVEFGMSIKTPVLVDNRNFELSLRAYASEFQFAAQGLLVCTFQKSRPENAMDLNRRTDDGIAEFVLSHTFNFDAKAPSREDSQRSRTQHFSKQICVPEKEPATSDVFP